TGCGAPDRWCLSEVVRRHAVGAVAATVAGTHAARTPYAACSVAHRRPGSVRGGESKARDARPPGTTTAVAPTSAHAAGPTPATATAMAGGSRGPAVAGFSQPKSRTGPGVGGTSAQAIAEKDPRVAGAPRSANFVVFAARAAGPSGTTHPPPGVEGRRLPW